jgi:2-oxoglutarate dehydrogenase E2 component (dihydrolipoamide succinyltransferase)
MIEVTIPQIGESITSVFIGRWIASVGAQINAGDSVVELDSDKASMEVPAPVSGVLVETLVEEGDEVPIGAVVARIDETATATASAAPAAPAADESEPAGVRAGPAARQAANEGGVDLATVTGTGPRGRVTTSDVAAAATPAAAAPAATAPPAATTPSVDAGPRFERVPMSPLRRTIARRLVQAQQEAAILTTFNEVDMSAVMALRKTHQEDFKKRYGIKLGFMSFFVKAAIDALKQYPAVNSEIDGTNVLYKNYYNVGVAVSGPKGLVVPVIKNADQLSFAGVELAIAELAGRARNNKLTLSDFADGTFTISNGGIFGSMMSTPILNRPQVGILGMHNIMQRPVGVNGEVVLRPMMYLAMSYDHRIIDGREAVSFLVRIKNCIESPERMLLEV